jgi:hypothetical protein
MCDVVMCDVCHTYFSFYSQMAAAEMDDAQEFIDTHLQPLQLPHVRSAVMHHHRRHHHHHHRHHHHHQQQQQQQQQQHLLLVLSSSNTTSPLPLQVSKKVKQLMSSSEGMLFALYR